MNSIIEPWISYCRIGETEIGLDLRQNRYFSVPAGSFKMAARHVEDQTIPRSRAVQMLIERGIVRMARVGETSGQSCNHLIPTSTLVIDRLQSSTDLQSVTRSAIALISIGARLKMRPLATILTATTPTLSKRENSRELASRTLLAFRVARLLFPGNESCLRDALALRALFAKSELQSTLVLGVSLAPFQAHSWLEMDGVVVGDNHERVAHFKPILAVS